MGICECESLKNKQLEDVPNKSIQTMNAENNQNINNQIIKKEIVFESQTQPMSEDETLELFSYKHAICKIVFETILDGQIKKGIGTGFFCKIHDKYIPFNKALFTNNHVLNENRIKMNEEIEFEYCEKKKTIKITKDRMVFTNNELDYTCIEILEKDDIKKFFNIDESIFDDKESLIKKEIFILQYPGGNLRFHCGKILDIKKNRIEHNVPTKFGSSGSPLIKRYNNNLIVGIHFGAQTYQLNDNEMDCNLAIPFDAIIKDIIYNLSQYNTQRIKYRKDIINLIYNKTKEGMNSNVLFGSDFVKNNKDNITLIINGKKSELIENYNLKKGKNNIQMIIDIQLTNLRGMFANVGSLENMEELCHLNTEKVTDFSWMFSGCVSLTNIKPLQNWNVSSGINFIGTFSACLSLSDIKPLQNWNVSNGKYFESMFNFCSSISDIQPLQNWNVSNGKDFTHMFSCCRILEDIRPLQNWDVSNGLKFEGMFSHCTSLSDIKPLQKWNVSNGTIFKSMFKNCSSLSDVQPLRNWDVSNGAYFKNMFKDCSPWLDISPLSNWKHFHFNYKIMV